jgi:plastocyanin
MSHSQHEQPIFRTSPERTWKMMAITLGICIAGGVIFFGMWDYWTSAPPAAASIGAAEVVAPAEFTGKEIPVTLVFVESSDFRTLAFNSLPGEPDHNPTLKAEVGDKIVFNVKNGGKSFHSFGVTQEDEGFGGIIPKSEIASASSPLKPGEDGQSEFIPGKEGVYYYICTVPGHREQGMVGKITVGDISDITAETKMTEPEPEPEVIAEPEPEVLAKPEPITTFSGTISLPSGSSVPGCDETNECYIPADVTVNVGDTVTWSNDDAAAHTVTSGTPTDGPDGIFDSSLFMSGTTFTHTFDDKGEYNYFCMVHPWMVGNIKVN